MDFKIIVEPQDAIAYKEYSEHLLILSSDDQGLAFSRNFAINYARQNYPDWFWMMDDDISKFYKTVNKKNIQISTKEALSSAELLFSKRNSVGQAALEYQQYSWSQSKDIVLGSYCDVCVCIHTKRTKSLKFRHEVNLKLDRDFTLQCLASGYQVLRTAHIAFDCPKNGSNEGGLYDDYKSGIEHQNVLEMCKIWGANICTPATKKDGRRDVKINWKYFK